MWLTAHRLGDLRRLVRQYGRDQADVFPNGTYWREGLQYGSDVNFPIYVDENNNPNFTGCLNRDA
jgi:starch-binding outer membrane protein, SusD/RagB family